MGQKEYDGTSTDDTPRGVPTKKRWPLITKAFHAEKSAVCVKINGKKMRGAVMPRDAFERNDQRHLSLFSRSRYNHQNKLSTFSNNK